MKSIKYDIFTVYTLKWDYLSDDINERLRYLIHDHVLYPMLMFIDMKFELERMKDVKEDLTI